MDIHGSVAPSNFTIKHDAEAKKTYDKYGKDVGIGHKTTRLDVGDERLNVAAKILDPTKDKGVTGAFKRIYLKLCFVKLSDQKDGTSIYVNVNSLANRLHLTKSEIKKEMKEANSGLNGEKIDLAKVIERRIVHQAKIINNYSDIIDKFKIDQDEGCLIGTGGLQPSTLMSVVRSTVPILLGPNSSTTSEHMSLHGRVFVVDKNADDKLTITAQKPNHILGEGSFGTVTGAINLNTKEELAFKQAKNFEMARRDLTKEYETNLALHPNKQPVRGLQEMPHAFVHITADKGEGQEIHGIMMPRFSQDMYNDKKIQFTMNERLNHGEDVLFGLNEMHQKGFVHGDLKEGNVSLDEAKNGQPSKAKICDLGGARRVVTQLPNDTDKFDWGTSTSAFISPAIYNRGYIAWTEAATGKRIKSRDPIVTETITLQERNAKLEEYNKAKARNDVFATGAVLYSHYMDGNLPYELNEKTDFPTKAQFDTEGLKNKLSQDPTLKKPEGVEAIMTLMKKMLDPINNFDLTAEQALKEFQEARALK